MCKDSNTDIALAKLMRLITDNFSNAIISKNGDGSSLLRIIGRSDLEDRFWCEMTVTTQNNGWINPYPGFNPQYFLNEVSVIVKDNKELLGEFLSEVFSRIHYIDEHLQNEIDGLLNILGYKLDVEFSEELLGLNYYKYKLLPYTEGVYERQADINYLEEKLQSNNLIKDYDAMVENYTMSNYSACIDTSRTLIENIFKRESDDNQFISGVLSFTGEDYPVNESNRGKLSQACIFKYWLDNKKSFNRSRLLITFYSALSGLGTHREDEPTREDTLWLIRMTEDILIWYFQTKDSQK